MGEPLPHNPEDKADPTAPRPKIDLADWMVGPEDGLRQPEIPRMDSAVFMRQESPRLTRPDSGQIPSPRESNPGSPFAILAAAQSPVTPVASHAPAMPSWDPGSSSVPKMRHSPGAAAPPASPIPELTRDFPMDDAEERALVSARLAEEQEREAAIAARPHSVVKPQEFDLPTVALPWWARVPSLLSMDRRVQLFALGVVLLLAIIGLRPRAEKTISVAHLKEHADHYADTPVRVGGRVSEVFPVGGSWAYTLVQGRDTIVVFTRTREPKAREKIVVVGTLSNGYLDGQSRVAIFENTR